MASDVVSVECSHCGYEWEYSGGYSVKTTCPNCQQKTDVPNDDGGPA